MPTARARHVITETDDVKAIIDEAAARWPEAAGNRTDLVRLLILDYKPAADREREARALRRRAAMRLIEERRKTREPFTYPPNYLADLRAEWPD